MEILENTPSTYYEMKYRRKDPLKVPDIFHTDEVLKPGIQRVWLQNLFVYGASKVQIQLKRESYEAFRLTVERLVRDLGLRGVTRVKGVRTIIPKDKAERPQVHSILRKILV